MKDRPQNKPTPPKPEKKSPKTAKNPLDPPPGKKDRPRSAENTPPSTPPPTGVLQDDQSSTVVAMIVREHHLREEVQQTRHEYQALVDEVRHRVHLLREHIETRRQNLRVAESCDDESRPAGATGEKSSRRRAPAGDRSPSDFDWIDSDDPRQALNQLLRLVEKHHRELDSRQRSLEDDLHDAAARRQSLSAKLKASQRDLERVTAARDRFENELSARQVECEQRDRESASLAEQLADTACRRDELEQQLNELQQSHESNLQRLYAELTLRETAEEQVVDLEASTSQLQAENQTLGETLVQVRRELTEKTTQLQADLTREQSQRAKLQTETNDLRQRLAACQEELAAEQARLQASRDDVSRLLVAHKELKAENRSLAQDAERTERTLSAALEDLRQRLGQMTAQHDGRRSELEALQRRREEEQAQHRAAREDWQATLRKVRQEAKAACDKTLQQQRQVAAEWRALREQHGDLAGRYEKLEQDNEELRAERTHLKVCLAAAETPAVSRRIVTSDGQQIRIDGPAAVRPPHRGLRFSELREKENLENGVRER